MRFGPVAGFGGLRRFEQMMWARHDDFSRDGVTRLMNCSGELAGGPELVELHLRGVDHPLLGRWVFGAFGLAEFLLASFVARTNQRLGPRRQDPVVVVGGRGSRARRQETCAHSDHPTAYPLGLHEVRDALARLPAFAERTFKRNARLMPLY